MPGPARPQRSHQSGAQHLLRLHPCATPPAAPPPACCTPRPCATCAAAPPACCPPRPCATPPAAPPACCPAAILQSKTAFPADPEGELDTTLPRLTYCAIHGLGVAFAVYKINSMGLLPTHLSDWVSSMRPPAVLEHAAGNLLR